MGRPAKVRPPPRCCQATARGSLDMLRVDHLAGLPQSNRLPYVKNADLSAAAEELNTAFERFAFWSAFQHRRAPPSEVRDWFSQVADQATGLLHALGHDRPFLAEHGFYEVINHLQNDAKPRLDGGPPDREQHAQHRMESLARRAMPEAYAKEEREGESNPGWQIAQNALKDRLKPTLELLHLLAKRGAACNAARIRKGGREQEEARKHLFVALSQAYARVFGKLPAAPSATPTKAEKDAGELRASLPKGPALNWFGALLDLVGTRAAEALPHCQPGGAAPDPDRAGMLCELMGLAAAAKKGKAADGLAHWIRGAAAVCAKNTPPVEFTGGQVKIRFERRIPRTPIEDVFG